MRMLETQRLLLKPVEEIDLPGLLEMQWDRGLMTFMNFKPISIEDQRDWWKSLGGDKIAFSIFHKNESDKELIGLVTLNQINYIHNRASWGIKLKSNLQTKGLGSEASVILMHYAFSILNLQKIQGDILFDNIANRKMCAKIGVREEGVLINHYYQNGKYRDVVLVGILKEEFYSKNGDILKNLDLSIE